MSWSLPLVGFTVLLAGTGVMRLAEVVISVRRMRARPASVVAEPWLFPAMAALHAAFVIGPLAEVWFFDRPFVPGLAGAALGVLALAVALRVWTLRTLGRAWNVRVVIPEETRVVTTGPYAWIRHPNYLVVILEIAALPLVHTAWMSAIALSGWNAVVLWRRIRTEEAALATLPAWRDAMAHRARLIPGVL